MLRESVPATSRPPITSLSPEWRTISIERTVLVVVHNVTAATRLFDVLPVIATDRRIQLVFTCPGSSVFAAGTAEYLAARDIPMLPWAQALQMPVDLAIAASLGGDLHKIRAPLIVLPHGMGYNKYLTPESKTGIGDSVFGLSTPWLLHNGKVVPSVIVLSHAEQLNRLRADCPEAVDAARVAGDPCFDRIVASVPLRESYRQAFGIAPDQRLIVVSSTWGSSSLYGSDPDLIQQLAMRLPLDSHRIAVALHPNITHGHSRWQIKTWLDQCALDGVLLLANEDDWRPALVAADLVIGDHGSVTFYAAALGTPILLAVAPTHTVDPRSPIAQLLRAAPRFNSIDPLDAIERAIAEHDPDQYADITVQTTSYPGEAAVRLEQSLYDLLNLRTPTLAGPPVAALPLPSGRFSLPGALLVTAQLEPAGPDELRTVVRHWAAGSIAVPALMPEGAHLVVDVDGPLTGLLGLADIVMHTHPEHAVSWIAHTLRALPGCLLAVARHGNGWLLGTADGGLVRLHTRSASAAVFGSAVHAWLSAGHGIHDLPGRLVVRPAPDQSGSDSSESRRCTASARAEKPRNW
jgi:hypothetical protein